MENKQSYLEHAAVTVADIDWSIDFVAMIPEVQTTKPKINKWDHIKLKNSCSSKDTVTE